MPTPQILAGPRPVTLQPPAAPVSSEPGSFNLERDTRPIADPAAIRQAVFDRTLAAAQSLPDLSNTRHTLRVKDVSYADEKEPSLAEQKRALLSGQSLTRRMLGTMELVDNATGAVLDSRGGTLARVPFVTPRGTIIHNGSEWSVNSQMRMRPGIYTRIKDNGEVESHANVKVGSGPSHRYFLDPDKGVFYTRLGQAKIPLMPLAKALGATDQELQAAWGPDIWKANIKEDRPAALDKYVAKLLRKGEVPENKAQALAEAVRRMELDPEVTKRTLGAAYGKLDKEPLLAITKKLLAVSRGEADVDDRDHLAFQEVLGPEDLFAERLSKDYGKLRRQLLWKASQKGNLQSLLSAPLTKQLEAVLLHSGLAEHLEEIGPAEILDRLTKVSRMGEGGIPSTDSTPDAARAVQPSHMSFIDGIRTPESSKAGVDLFFANHTRKGKDGRLYAPFTDVKSGQTVWKSPQQLQDLTIAFPGELKRREGKRVGAMRGGKLGFYPREEVDLVVPHFENAFSPLANFVPLKSGSKGQRMAMASRMTTQALPLKNAQAPFVQTGVPDADNQSYEDRFGRQMGALFSDKPARVLSVTPQEIKLRYEDGTEETKELAENFVFNRKTRIHNTPLVAPGDFVQPGQILAKSNFTDDKGTAALGLNARVGFMSSGGLNHEDAVIVSESFANRATSDHMYSHGVEWSPKHKKGKGAFLGAFPGKYDKSVLDTLDEDGVVLPGTKVSSGHPLVLAVKERETARNKVHKKGQAGFTNDTDEWDHHQQGVVTDVVKTPKGATVLVQSYKPLEEGDKLSNRYGGKGIISQVMPDHKMPRGEDGEPLEVLLGPLGLISRVNASQIVEAALGKIAAKTGKPYKVKDFEDIEDLVEFAQKELKKHGMKDLETVFDPVSNRHVPGVLVGNKFLMNLHHQAASKGQGRGTGGYTSEGTPSKGGESGSKRIGLLDSNAILSHGAYSVLRDASAIRGQRNEDYWLAFMSGHRPPNPQVPMVYEKFINQMKGSGINVVRSGPRMRLLALTDKDIDTLAAGRELKNAETVKGDKGLAPVPGGLFDPKLTGGHHGTKWASLKLHEPLPSPVFEEPIRRLLGLTEKDFLATLSGQKHLGDHGTGPAGIRKALSAIDLDKEIQQARAAIAGGRKTARDAAVRKLGYLKAAQSTGVHPSQWMLSKVPVLPPKFRPISQMGDKKIPLVADVNLLYKELFSANQELSEMSDLVDDVSEERLAAYKALKAVTGLDDPVHPKLKEKGVSGLLRDVFGSGPKYSVTQRKLLSSPADLVGRAVLSADPDLGLDQIALPEEKAWEVYQPFIARRLRRRGLPLVQALKEAKGRTPLAREEMLKEMAQRPVISNRAPVLHKFGMLAFWPVLTKGHTMKLNPMTFAGFNADLDGDMMQYHVPVDEDAVREAVELMLPSKNLLSPADFKTPMHKPTQEYVGGLYQATGAVKTGKRPRTFSRLADAKAAFRRGELDIDDPITILS